MDGVNQAIEQIKPLFEKLGEKLGQGAAYGWQIMIRQQYVFAVQYILAALGMVAGFLGALWLYRKGAALPKDRYDDTPIVLRVLGVIGMIVSGALVFVFIGGGISHLINPAYYALMDVMGMVKGQ